MDIGKLMESAVERFSLPGELAGAARVTLTGDCQLLVENHRGLLEYGEEIIRLSAGRYRLRVTGQGLHLLAMDGCSMIIKGKIFGIDLE